MNIMNFRRYDTTEPVKAFVFEQLEKRNAIMLFADMSIKDLKTELKSYFKTSIGKWVFKRADWETVALAIKEKINEHKELER